MVEANDLLRKAGRTLAKARKVDVQEVPDLAARESYLAMFHAAQAYIPAHTGKSAKTHRGVRNEFARLARSDAAVDGSLPTALAQGYRVKEVVDYGIEVEDHWVSDAEAEIAMHTAQLFIDTVARALADRA